MTDDCTWTNWAGNVSFAVADGVREPTSEAEIRAHVADAARRRVPLRVVGHGHSFNRSMCADGGVTLSLRRYRRVLRVDAAARTVTCETGITLVQLCEALEDAEPPLTLENVPVVLGVTVAGALAVAAHGSGVRSQCVSAHLLGCTLIDGRGDVLTIDAAHNPELLPAARASLGVLGVLSTVTLQCVPARTLHISEGPMRLSECVERLDELSARYEYFKAWWVPHTGAVHAFCIDGAKVPPLAQIAREPVDGAAAGGGGGGSLASARDPLAADAAPLPARASFLNSRPGGAFMEGMLALAAEQPACTPLVNCALRPLLFPTLESAESSYLVQCNEHRGTSESVGVRFEVSEYALPAKHCKAALTELVGALQAEAGLYLSFPVGRARGARRGPGGGGGAGGAPRARGCGLGERGGAPRAHPPARPPAPPPARRPQVDIRFSAADDIWLSPAHGRATAWIGIPAKRPFNRETPHAAMFERFEQIMLRHGGRPHWAKDHSLRAPELAALYPRWADFLKARARLDPDGVFLNGYLREIFGVPAAARSRM